MHNQGSFSIILEGSHVPFCPPSTVTSQKGQDKIGQNRHTNVKSGKNWQKNQFKRDIKGQKGTLN